MQEDGRVGEEGGGRGRKTCTASWPATTTYYHLRDDVQRHCERGLRTSGLFFQFAAPLQLLPEDGCN